MLTAAISIYSIAFDHLQVQEGPRGCTKICPFPVYYEERNLVWKLFWAAYDRIVKQWISFLNNASGWGGTRNNGTSLE